jgi:putative DNA primase/helicase
VLVAFNCGNLEPVCRTARKRWPDIRLVIAADDDWKTRRPNGEPWNPGIECANAAALASGGLVAVPAFPADRADKQTDFNDSMLAMGPEAVRQAVEAAQAPMEASEAQPPAKNRSDGVVAVPAGEWREPEPIGRTDKAEPYPVDAWPGVIGDAIREVIESAQVPPALAGQAALTFVSVAGMGLADVSRGEGLHGPTGLYLLTICDSGERKSSVDLLFSQGLEEWKTLNAERHADAFRAYLTDKAIWTSKRDGLLARIKRLTERGPESKTAPGKEKQ